MGTDDAEQIIKGLLARVDALEEEVRELKRQRGSFAGFGKVFDEVFGTI